MSFDIKYNRDGMPIKSAAVQDQIIKAAQAVEQPASVAQPEPMVEIQTQPEPEMVEAQTEEVEQESAPVEAPVAKDKNFNLRLLRERAEQAERERDELMRMMYQKDSSKKQVEPEPEEDLNFNMDADALVEGKHLSKVDKKIRQLEQKLAKYEQRSTESNAETRLKAQYSDFDSVVTADNVAQLREEYPELAQALIATPDLYAKGKSAYMLLKKFGIAQDPVVQAEKALVMKNAAKPRPLASVSPQQGSTPMAQANAFAEGLTPSLKDQLNREMYEARRNH